MATSGYDGIDVDWEPMNDSDTTLFTNFVTHLRAALDGFSTHKLMTVAVPTSTTPSILASVQSKFDQINLMTYDLSGPWDGWVTWFNSPIYNDGLTFPSATDQYVPSIDGAVTNFLAAGIATNKLGIGIPFYGYIWQGGTGTPTGGATQPFQGWTTVPNVNAFSYNDLMSSNFTASQYHYDAGAQAAYFSVTNSDPANDMFISYEDPRACAAKVNYARNRGVGGFIIWELTRTIRAGKPDPLLQAIRQTMQTPGTVIQPKGPVMSLNFTSAPLGSYQVQWSSNLTAWVAMLSTNMRLNWTGGIIQTTDLPTQTKRFYRVKTPP